MQSLFYDRITGTFRTGTFGTSIFCTNIFRTGIFCQTASRKFNRRNG